ncbi:MAG: alpha-amylase family glycosyl hydrolase [Chitinophagaceae bacterium]|nr:alpha-amylase family glycosyl hydrolase [Chitinophagaceae bacterium]
MYNHHLHQHITDTLQEQAIDPEGANKLFFTRFIANATAIDALFREIYGHREDAHYYFDQLIDLITTSHATRSDSLKKRDETKMQQGTWFLSNAITGMSLYVDRFCGNLPQLEKKLGYFQKLGVNFLHLMPVFESPAGESDGGYAVSDFRKVDSRFGHLDDLCSLQEKMQEENMYLMLDIVLNHTSHKHAWAQKARKGERKYQDYFYMFDNRVEPDHYDQYMPEIFPESAPGNFTWVPEINKWVMTVFHNYQWDLNYRNPAVFLEMLETIFFYANLGVDVLRIDAPAFIWKQAGTTCQNLPQAHTLLRLIKQCVQVSAPGMALLGEAIVAPREIMKYFGTGLYTAKECDFAYNATHMALQWDALATADTRVMLAAQHEILQKPYGTSWINYTRCHDDIGLGYDDYMIRQAGFDPFEHRKFLKDHYSGNRFDSPARGALFSVNPKTNDARISGSLASLCGLEKALEYKDEEAIELAIRKILLLQAHSFFLGGIPMLFYGDELGYTNDYSYLGDPGKSYDNRWMHRPVIDWKKYERANHPGTVEHRVFTATQRLINLRKELSMVADHKNLTWMTPHNIHIAGYLRTFEDQKLYCLFNFSNQPAYLTWYAFKEHGAAPQKLFDHWEEREYVVGYDHEYLVLQPYGFMLLEA